MKTIKGRFGIYFMKGAFFLQLKEVDDTLIALPLTSKGTREVGVCFGEFEDIESSLQSDSKEEITQMINNLEYDYIVLAQGDTCVYYLNTTSGVKKCDIELYILDE